MKNIFKFLFVSLLASLVLSCEKDEDRAVVGDAVAGLLKSDKTDVVLTKENANVQAVTFSWDNPNYGPNLALNNQLEIATEGTNFEGAKSVDLAAGTKSISYTNQEFNAVLLGAGIPVGETTKIELRLKSSAGSTVPMAYSPVIKMTVTTYASISYLYVPGAYQGWNPSTANTLISPTSNGEYVAYIDFSEANSEFKITTERTWDNSYGTDDNINLIYNGGGNIKAVNAGSQKLVVDLNAKTFKLTAHSWGVIGSATPGGWDADTDMFFDDATQRFVLNNVTLSAGEIKFRLNNDWSTNYGGSNGNAVAGGDNIAIADAGTYKIEFDQENLKYFITKL